MNILVAGEDESRDEWATMLSKEHEVTCLGPEAHPDLDSIVGPVTERDTFKHVTAELDAIVDLPVIEEEDAPWESQLRPYYLTHHLLEACRDASIETYILGSSNMVMQGYEVDHAPDLYEPDYDLLLDHTSVPQPLSMYGVARLFSEFLGYRYVESTDWQVGRLQVEEREFPMQFYVLRWGSLRFSEEVDHPYGDAEYGVKHGLWDRDDTQYELAVKRMKATWFSGRDWEQLVNLMLEDDSVEFDIFYGVSDNDRRWFDIQHASEVLGYDPQDNAEEWEEPPRS